MSIAGEVKLRTGPFVCPLKTHLEPQHSTKRNKPISELTNDTHQPEVGVMAPPAEAAHERGTCWSPCC